MQKRIQDDAAEVVSGDIDFRTLTGRTPRYRPENKLPKVLLSGRSQAGRQRNEPHDFGAAGVPHASVPGDTASGSYFLRRDERRSVLYAMRMCPCDGRHCADSAWNTGGSRRSCLHQTGRHHLRAVYKIFPPRRLVSHHRGRHGSR